MNFWKIGVAFGVAVSCAAPAAEEFGLGHLVAQARNTQADATGHGVHQLQDAGK